MRTTAIRVLIEGVMAGLASVGPAGVVDAADEPQRGVAALSAAEWDYFIEESRIQRLHHELSIRHQPKSFLLENVQLVAMTEEVVRERQSVLVRDGRIAAIDRAGELDVPADVRRIDGKGRFLLPGLTDMHTHNLVTTSQHLLNLANGVTTVRDMCGFDWLLATRERAARNKMLAPNLYVAGHILNAFPMDWYATVVKEPEGARTVVRGQAAAGYDFIKVHNRLDVGVYHAILDEAGKIGIDVVGHIPHEISVGEAIRAGQRTLEHFKGYIQDWNLELTSDDYVAATRGADVWICPTFYTYRMHLAGDEARRLIGGAPEMRYVSYRDRAQWLRDAEREPSRLHQGIYSLSKKVFRDLMAINAQFIAGTDSGGGYPHMVTGFALHEELRIMDELGLSPYETIQTATINAARAMRKEHEFGTIEAGKRADLLLVRGNPLESVGHLAEIDGVMVRGIWLSREDLDAMLAGLEEIFNPAAPTFPPEMPGRAEIDALWMTMRAMHAEGYVFRGHDLKRLAGAFEAMGAGDRSRAVRAMLGP